MDKDDTKNEERSDNAVPDPTHTDANTDPVIALDKLTEKWKRALADAENARKRADLARLDGQDHGIAVAVEALVPTYDAVCRAMEAAQVSPAADKRKLAAHMDGLKNIRSAFETGLKALGVRIIAPKNTPFDPMLHEAMQIEETDETNAGEVLVLHRSGLALGKRLIRPAHVTVSASPGKPAKD